MLVVKEVSVSVKSGSGRNKCGGVAVKQRVEAAVVDAADEKALAPVLASLTAMEEAATVQLVVVLTAVVVGDSVAVAVQWQCQWQLQW